jgi:hypothetical protein
MKITIPKFIIAGAFAVIAEAGFTQTKDESHVALTVHHHNAKVHATAITNDSTKTKKEKIKGADETTKSIEDAKKAHENLKTTVPAKDRAIAKPHHEAIEKYHTEAANHAKALNEELKKPFPDEAKLNEHVKKIRETITSAEKEHEALKAKTKK